MEDHQHQLTIVVQPDATAVTLRIRGELDLASVRILRDCLEELDAGYRRVILDMAELSFIDSAGLNLLVLTKQGYEPELRELVLLHPGPSVRRVLEVSGVDQVLSIGPAHSDAPESSVTG